MDREDHEMEDDFDPTFERPEMSDDDREEARLWWEEEEEQRARGLR
jgi:hypothetical protein